MMLLERGTAQTDTQILAEYYEFLPGVSPSAETLSRFEHAAERMIQIMEEPIGLWEEEAILRAYQHASKHTRYGYNAFLAFLFLYGYQRASFSLLQALPIRFASLHRRALEPYAQQILLAQRQLRYGEGKLGTELNLLMWVLFVTGKSFHEITSADFEAFSDTYYAWYRTTSTGQSGRASKHLARLGRYFSECWKIFTPTHPFPSMSTVPRSKKVVHHQDYFAQLHAPTIRSALKQYMQFCDVKYRPSTIGHCRHALLRFFMWLQIQYPNDLELDKVTRPITLSFAQYLREQQEAGAISTRYASKLYHIVRGFFEFAIEEQLPTAPLRNPFGRADLPRQANSVLRYLTDHEIRALLAYCQQGATLKERTVIITFLHTGLRRSELAALKSSDIVNIQGRWKLHVREGKGLKDRLIPLTQQCLDVLQAWQAEGWEGTNDYLFSWRGRPPSDGHHFSSMLRDLSRKIGIPGVTPHRLRHTFAVALINYGIREVVLQKLMGHASLDMTLEYGRILDRSVETAFDQAIEHMQGSSHTWVPSFFIQDDYTTFIEEDSVSWIKLPVGFCRRNPKLHCESDVKCFLCDRFQAQPSDLPRLREMYERFSSLHLEVKAQVVLAQIRQLEQLVDKAFIPTESITIGTAPMLSNERMHI